MSRDASEGNGLQPASRRTRGGRSEDHTPWDTSHQIRRDRHGVSVTTTKRTGTPSIGLSQTFGPGGMLSHALFTCTAFSPHPFPCLEPCLPRQRLAGRFRLSRPEVSPDEQDASHRLLQPTHNTSTLRTVRFPSHGGHLAASIASQLRAGQRPSLSSRVEASFDDEPPASA